jgi:hypothetical protein
MTLNCWVQNIRACKARWELEAFAYLVFLAAKSLKIAPGCLVHRIGVTHIRRSLVILFGSYWVFLHAPAVSEAVRQFEDGKCQFPFGSSPFLHSRLERESLDIRAIRCCVRQVCDCASFVLWNAPTVSSICKPEHRSCWICIQTR